MIKTVKNAINILNCFSDRDEEMGIKELAEMLNQNTSTVHHLVKTLNNNGILVQTVNRKYRLGSRVLDWSQVVTEQFNSIYDAVPYLDEIVSMTQESVELAIRENKYASSLIKIDPNKTDRVKNVIGVRRPLYSTALGKVLLSENFKQKDIEWMDFNQYTNNTINNPERLIQELRQIVLNGYAIDDMECKKDVYSIAVPIRSKKGKIVCAISVSGQKLRILDKKEQTITLLKQTAKKISRNLQF